MSFLSGLIVGLIIGSIGGLIVAYFVYRNNKAKILALIEKAKKLGVVISE